MATTNPRLNVTLSKDQMAHLAYLAEKEEKSLSAKASELIDDALELEEDLHLSILADKRLAEAKDEDWVSHEEFWGEVLKDE